MNELIEELEAAPCGSRYLDWKIAKGLGLPVVCKRGNPDVMSAQFPYSIHVSGGVDEVSYYTMSLDASRSLSNWVLVFASDIGADGLAMVELGDPSHSPSVEVCGIHSILEIAWCIAGLRARQRDAMREIRQLGQEMEDDG